MKRESTIRYKKQIHQLIPGGAHTYSKGDDQFPENAPAAISHGKGAYVWDIDGNRFLDCSMGLSSVSLGHAFEPVLNEVKAELDLGVNFQRPSYIEKEMAETFLALIPQHDRIKFSKNGSAELFVNIAFFLEIIFCISSCIFTDEYIIFPRNTFIFSCCCFEPFL